MLHFKMARKMTPRHDDGLLHVLMIGRVSTERQEESNIEAGYEYARRTLKQIYEGHWSRNSAKSPAGCEPTGRRSWRPKR